MFHKQQGFSLIEVLVVLSLFTILLTLTLPISYSLLEKKTEEKVLEMFQYDILFLQNQSIANGREDYLRMVFSKNGYTLTDTNKELLTRMLPKGWEIDTRTLNYISFKHGGTTRYSGTIEIISPNNRYTLTFPIGKGRGYIEKR
ncbi:competence type IV pilus minor pilin ComGD [Paucisalibacillus sp. EB02]|uniref:competence type IV pilus minor pilin ComGD n=1 Tax=Paucisalibacillus sp. EB02 TaxID=1347087 RepID=UPI0005A932D9|nr:competence type IV pilus minor pilin ComGD [Paucisalibacillus sp. EB02]